MSPKAEKKETKKQVRKRSADLKEPSDLKCKKSKPDTSTQLPRPLYAPGFPPPPVDLKWDTEPLAANIVIADTSVLQKFKNYMQWHFASKHPYTLATSTTLVLQIDVPNLPFKMGEHEVGYGEVQVKIRDSIFGGPFVFVPMREGKTAVVVEIGHYYRSKIEGTISCRMWTANTMSSASDIRSHLWARCQAQERDQLGYTLITALGEEVHLHKEVIRSFLPHLDKLTEMGKSSDRHTLPGDVGIGAVHAFVEFLYWGMIGSREWWPCAAKTKAIVDGDSKSKGASETKSADESDSKLSSTSVNRDSKTSFSETTSDGKDISENANKKSIKSTRIVIESESNIALGELWRLSDYFQLEPLQSYLVPKIARAISSGGCPFATALTLVKTHPMTEWKEAISGVLQKNPELLWQTGIDVTVRKS